MRKIFAVALAVGLAVGLMTAVATPAGADPNNKNTLSITLDCGAEGTIDAVFELSSADAFHLVDVSGNFVWKTLSFTDPDTGQTFVLQRGGEGGGHGDLTTCSYTGPVSGNHYTVVGFFTP